MLLTLEERFLAPDAQAALRAEIERQEAAERAGAEVPAADLDRRIAALAKKIDAGMERWLTAPPELVAAAGAKLERWRQEREVLEEQRRAVAKPADSGAALEAVAEQVAAAVATLRARAADAPPDLVRPVLREMLEKVVVEFRHEPFGRRTRSVPNGGVMHLRGCCRSVTIAGANQPADR
jgi:hypothetical protein